MSDLLTLEPELVTNVRRTTLHGREYVVADVTILKEGVLSGSKGPLFYPFEEIARRPGIWNGVPLTNGHPTDTYGNPISARTPDALNKFGLGQFFSDTIDDGSKTRRGEIWVDVQVANRVLPELIPAIEAKKQIDISTGLFTSDQLADNGANHGGKAYTHIARDHLPDHLAILIKDKGACSVKDGCGINVNQLSTSTLLSEVTKNVTPSDSLDMTPEKACQILRDKTVHGKPITERQRGMFGALCGKRKKKKKGIKTNVSSIPKDTFIDYPDQFCDPKVSTCPLDRSLTEVPMDRTQLVNWLTTNCECWKGKNEVLQNEKSFTDDDLKKLKANAEASTLAINTLREVGTTLELPKNATLDDLKTAVTNTFEKAKAKADDDDDDEEDTKGKKMKTNKEMVINALKEIPEKEVLELFPSLKQTVNAASEVVNEKRMEIMRQLTANISDEKEKKGKLLMLKDKTLPQLREFLAFAGTTNTETPKDDNETFLANFFKGNYAGANGTDPNTRNSNSSYDKSNILPPTTLNVYEDEEEDAA